MTLLGRMLVEEFRLHTELFGRQRFVVFPVLIATIVAGGVWLLAETGTSATAVVAGLHILIFFFGLQVGTIGLVGRDAMRDLLGDRTLLVFSARTLPLLRERLLGIFIVKDIIYYALLFLTPVVVGFLPLVLAGTLSLGQLGLLWLTIAGTFALGTASSLTLAGVGTRSMLTLVAFLAAIVVGLITAPLEIVRLTPYVFYTDPTVTNAISGFAPLAVLLVASPVLFKPNTERRVRRIENNRYRQLCRLGGGFTARPLLEVVRSSGSVWKIALSLGILFVVTAVLLNRLSAVLNIHSSAGIAFGTLLGLGTFTTYNWVTQFDDPREYLRYPSRMDAVFVGKLRAFLVLSLPTGFGYLALAGIWYPLGDLLAGVIVFPLVTIYIFGLTAYLTGLSPNELLFDTVLFVVYSGAIAIVAVPLLVASIAYGTVPFWALTVALGLSVVAAIVGLILAKQAGDRWHTQLRRA